MLCPLSIFFEVDLFSQQRAKIDNRPLPGEGTLGNYAKQDVGQVEYEYAFVLTPFQEVGPWGSRRVFIALHIQIFIIPQNDLRTLQRFLLPIETPYAPRDQDVAQGDRIKSQHDDIDCYWYQNIPINIDSPTGKNGSEPTTTVPIK